MTIPEEVIEILNAKLNVTSQPHFTYVGNERVHRGCLEWSVATPADWVDLEAFSKEVDILLNEVRQQLSRYPVLAYKSEIDWFDMTVTLAKCLVVAPITNQFDILRIEETEAGNYGFQTEDIVDKMMELDQRFGVDIIGASYGILEFLLKSIPTGKDAHELGEWLVAFCPDIGQAPTEYPAGKIALWWD
jgi:hypothetical protein